MRLCQEGRDGGREGEKREGGREKEGREERREGGGGRRDFFLTSEIIQALKSLGKLPMLLLVISSPMPLL